MIRSTSIEVYRQIEEEGLLSRRRFEVYSALYRGGPCTANELFQFMKRDGLCSTINQQANLTPRLGELREVGCVAELGEVTCPVTGRIVIKWQTTDNLPHQVRVDALHKIDQELAVLKRREMKLLARRRELLARAARSEDKLQFGLFGGRA